MRLFTVLITFLAGLASAGVGLGAEESPLRALSAEEFAKSGLNKLTAEELAFLEAALARHRASETVVVPAAAPTAVSAPTQVVVQSKDKSAAAFGAEQVTPAKRLVTEQELHARIEGTIESFTGRAVFVLDNGQIWQQRMPETVYFTPKLVNPEVVITRSFGGYKMLIVPADRVVFVKRVQ